VTGILEVLAFRPCAEVHYDMGSETAPRNQPIQRNVQEELMLNWEAIRNDRPPKKIPPLQ
jgi:hypothetical protein